MSIYMKGARWDAKESLNLYVKIYQILHQNGVNQHFYVGDQSHIPYSPKIVKFPRESKRSVSEALTPLRRGLCTFNLEGTHNIVCIR